jgi:tetratricopeptide (TPR) repeat protein
MNFKKLFYLLLLISLNLFSQNQLKFDKRNVQCEDKWVAFQMNKDSTYTFGFIYIDSQAGLTFNSEGQFKIEKNGIFKKIEDETKRDVGFIKARLKPNRVAIAELNELQLEQLKVEKIPSWLKNYKTDENTVERLYRWGYMYNGWNEVEKGLTFLEKANKINSNFTGLQTELAFSYNALGKYTEAESALNKAIKNNPNDCYTYKELAYTYTKQANYEKVATVYTTMTSICKAPDYIQETAHNLAYYYFTKKDKIKFKEWKEQVEKWSKSENQFTKNLAKMEIELNK